MAKTFGQPDAWLASGDEQQAMISAAVQTTVIRDFLREDDRCFLVGTKGTGKTLFLLAKAYSKRQRSEVRTLPGRWLEDPADRLTFTETLGDKFWYYFSDPSDIATAWTAVWKNTLMKAVLYDMAASRVLGLSETHEKPSVVREYEAAQWRTVSEDIKSLFGRPPYNRHRLPSDFYRENFRYLDSDPQQTLQKINRENDTLTYLLKEFKVAYYIFLDNLDHLYESNPDLWFMSIFAQYQAIRDLRLDLKHVHIYTSLRQDVFVRFQTEKSTQFSGLISVLEYDDTQLIEIFSEGIKRLDSDLLLQPKLKTEDPLSAFFGDAKEVTNKVVSHEREKVMDYILRHSLRRPRDLIIIGNEIVKSGEKLGFRKDTMEDVIRQGVEAAATQIAEAYLEEIAPSMSRWFIVPDFLKRYVFSNILSRDDAERICRRFNEENVQPQRCLGNCNTCDNLHPFCAMYLAGLLGWAEQSTVTGQYHQSFLRPGEMRVTAKTEEVPRSNFYFLHPVLHGYLTNEKVNKRCIVGYNHLFDPASVRAPA